MLHRLLSARSAGPLIQAATRGFVCMIRTQGYSDTRVLAEAFSVYSPLLFERELDFFLVLLRLLKAAEWFWHQDTRARRSSVDYRNAFKWRSSAVPWLELKNVLSAKAVVAEAECSQQYQKLMTGSSHLG